MTDVTACEIRRAALNLLARREYCFQELTEKLSRCYPNSDHLNAQVRLLADEGLQSDQRYVESFVRSRVQKGQGPLRINYELTQKGVSESLVSQVFIEADIDWCLMLRTLYERKYGDSQPLDENEKAKRIRFLYYRGFNFEQVKLFFFTKK